MQYLEKLSEMHSQATQRDLIVLIYGVLCAFLVGSSAVMLKKSEDLTTRVRSEAEEIKSKHSGIMSQVGELEGKICAIEASVSEIVEKHAFLRKDVSVIVSEIEAYRYLSYANFVSQVLSEALMSISIFLMSPEENEYLNMFTININQVATWCEKIDFRKIDDRLVGSKFLQRLGHVRTIYDDAAKKHGRQIDARHQEIIKKRIDKIMESIKK